jgi:hypothetical protein
MSSGFAYAGAFFGLALAQWLGIDLTPHLLLACGVVAVGAGITQEWRRS